MMDNDFFKNDSKRNGMFSTLIRKISDMEKFVRDHQAIAHSLQTFVDRTSFTPAISGSTLAGVGTYSVQLGEYSRVGNIVFFELMLAWSAHTGTGNMTVTGLPISAANNSISPPLSVFWTNLTLLAVGNKLMATVGANSTTITLIEIGSGASSSLPMDAAGQLRLAGFYFVD